MAQAKPRLTTDPGPEFDQCIRDALDLLRRAADSWAEGDPEDPATEEVLNRLLLVFEDKRFLRRPTGW